MACVDDMLGISARARRQPASTPKPVKQMDVLCGYSVPLIPYTRRLSICRYEIKKNVYLWKYVLISGNEVRHTSRLKDMLWAQTLLRGLMQLSKIIE